MSDLLVLFLDKAGMDVSALDTAVADYITQLGSEGGTEEETWSVLEGCYPELEEAPETRRAFSDLFKELQQPHSSAPASANLGAVAQPSPSNERRELTQNGKAGSSMEALTGREKADVDFLREMMPQVSDRGLRYVLCRVVKGDREKAASYLADRCAGGAASALKALEEEAEGVEQRELDDGRRAGEAARRAEEAKMRDKAERDSLKGKIVGRYADEVEGSAIKVVVPGVAEKKKTTRYRDGKVVTTTGAKVIVESVKPEWDGGSRGKVKTKGKRGKGFV